MKKYVRIEGIHCKHCIDTITKELLKNKNIKKVSIKNNIAIIDYENELSNPEIISTINNIDYFTKDEYIYNTLDNVDTKIKLKEFVLIFISIILIGLSLEKLFGYNIFNVIPSIDTNITYGMLILTGLLTSIHCVSMCGAINLITIVNNNPNLKKKTLVNSCLYNLGRVISYTLLGGLVGAIGSVFKISSTISGLIILIAAFIMFLMSLNMLGITNFHLPRLSKLSKSPKLSRLTKPQAKNNSNLKLKNKTNNAFIVGLLNGFMPCGPLQAMQVYALSTGSFLKGALSMCLFSLGTVPLMLGVGIFYNLIKGQGKIIINKIASVLILILSLVMLNRGLLALNVDITKVFTSTSTYQVAKTEDGIQVIEFDLSYNSYQDIKVKKDIPVKIIINVSEKYLTGCNNEIILPDFNIAKKLEVGKNIIEFTPSQTGLFTYTCWMQMLKNNIEVTD